MAALGRACMLLALAVCVYGAVASIYGVRSGRMELAESGRRSMYALAGVLTVAFVVLELAFLRNDFSFNTVADTSSRTTPALYRAAAVWSSQEGELQHDEGHGENARERVHRAAARFRQLQAAAAHAIDRRDGAVHAYRQRQQQAGAAQGGHQLLSPGLPRRTAAGHLSSSASRQAEQPCTWTGTW